MNIAVIISIAAILAFAVYFIYNNGHSKEYLLFVVYALPVMDLKVTPFEYGGLSVFDIITLTSLIILVKDFFQSFNFSRYYFLLFGVFMFTLILSSLASDFAVRSLFSLISVVTPFIYARFLIREILDDTEFIKEIFKGLRFAGYVALAFIFIQLFIGTDFTFYETLNQNVAGGTDTRYPGYFMDSQMNSIFLAMISFIWLLNFKSYSKITSSQLIFFSMIIGGLLLAGSRSAFLGFSGAMIFLIIFLKGNFRFYILRYTALAALVLFLASGTINTFQRFNTIDNAYDFRSNIWEGAYDIFKENPVLGIGMNNYQDYVKMHAQDQSLLLENNEIFYLDQPENGYLKLLTEWGILSFILLIVMLSLPLINMFYYFIKGYEVRWAILMSAPIVCWFISFMSLYTLSDSRIVILLCTAIVMVMVFSQKHIIFEET